jgi:hypothetical protein
MLWAKIRDTVVDGQSAKSGTIETSNKEVSIAMANAPREEALCV